MKKRLSILISLLMIIFMATVVSASNEVWVSSAVGSPGETVSISVSLGRFYGLASLKLSLEYDSNNLTLTDIRYSDNMPGQFQLPETFANPTVMNWYDTKNCSGDSDFAVLTFKIHKDALGGEYDIVLGVYQRETFGYGADGSVIPYEFPIPYNGVITVEGAEMEYVRVSEITLSEVSLNMEVGDKETLEADVFPADASFPEVTWYSSNDNVVTVDKSGRVYAVGAGTANITARADNAFATCRVKVEAKHSHVFSETVLEKKFLANAATCTKKAEYYYSCSCQAISSETFTYGTTLSHTFGEWITVTPPTEYSDGMAEAVCTECLKAKEIKILPAIGHEHKFDQKLSLPTYLAEKATCVKQAKYYFSCKCGEAGQTTFSAGNLAAHIMICHEYKEPTCSEEGIELHYECEVCRKLFIDEAGTSETTAENVKIPKTSHTPSGDWKWDEYSHWKSCICGAKTEVNVHRDTNDDGFCDVCGYEIKNESGFVTVRGKITAYGSADDEILIELIPVGETQPILSMTIPGDATEYVLENIRPGSYVLRVQKKNHVAREYELNLK